MVLVVQVLVQMYAFATSRQLESIFITIQDTVNSLLVIRIVPSQLVQHPNLDFTRIAILLHRTDNLDGDFTSRLYIAGFDDFTKRPLAE